MQLEQHFIPTNGVTLHVVTAGAPNGVPVFLLHGFPEFWYGWHKQIEFLAAHGFRVIVPDQRGYNLSEKPKQVSAYDLDVLVGDVLGLFDYFGVERAYLAAHDWGAVVAWWLAEHFPQRLRKLVILNVPHPGVVMAAVRRGFWRQAMKSWYILAFQLPVVPEQVALRTATSDRNLMRMSSLPDTFTEADIVAYNKAWQRPGGMTAMMNWYRALLRRGILPEPAPLSIGVPTLILWGEQDVALDKEMAILSERLLINGRLQFYPNASHWLQHDEADAVNGELLRFFDE